MIKFIEKLLYGGIFREASMCFGDRQINNSVFVVEICKKPERRSCDTGD